MKACGLSQELRLITTQTRGLTDYGVKDGNPVVLFPGTRKYSIYMYLIERPVLAIGAYTKTGTLLFLLKSRSPK